MPRKCSVCLSSQREDIDRALVGGEPLRGIARTFRVSEDALGRHKPHVSTTLAKAAEIVEEAAADDLATYISGLRQRTERIVADAEASKDGRTALLGCRELARQVELVLRAQAMLEQRAQNPFLDPRWARIRDAIVAAVQPHPAAARDVAAALAELAREMAAPEPRALNGAVR